MTVQDELDDNYRRFGCHHTHGGRVLRRGRTAAAPWLEDKVRRSTITREPIRFVMDGARAFNSARGLADPHDIDYHAVRTTADRIHHLAREYDRLPHFDPAAVPHFDAMRRQVHDQFEYMTRRMGVRTEFVDHDPYANSAEMAHDLATNKRIQVMKTATTGGHPYFSNRENDRFRAVHDVFGHAGTGRDFDKHGEHAAWLAHSRMFDDHAIPALSSETQGQNGHLIYHGEFGPQKVAVMHSSLWTPEGRDVVHRTARKLPKTERCEYCSNQATKRLLWAEGMAYIPVCDGHEDRGRHRIEVTNHDEVVGVKPVEKSAALDLEEYRLADHAQRRRYETAGNGSDSKDDYDYYYGQGEQEGRGKERRVTLKDFMQHSRNETLDDTPPEFQENWRGHELGYRHARSGHIDQAELAAAHSVSPHPDEFLGGYHNGLAAGFGEPVDDHRVAVMLDEHGEPTKIVASMRRTAHVSDNQVDVLHCSFCGSGGIVARSDGSIECTFCNSAFTVTVSPVYPAFPMSVSGQPYPWPGRPDGGVDPSMMAPMGDPAAAPNSGFGGQLVPGGPGGAAADGDDDSDADADDSADSGDGPPWAKDSKDDGDDKDDPEAEVGGKKKPPFGKKSYLTATGARLPEVEYLRHLAIATADDPNAMAARIRAERRG